MQYLAMTPDGTPVHLDETLTRAHFEEMTSDLLGRCRTPFNNVLHDAGISVSDIDHVVLVGGSTRMPAVKELVKELTGGKEANQSVNPDEVVAVGAAVQSGVIKGDRKDVLLIDGGSGLPKDEIDRMVKEAEAHEAEDKKRKEDAETRNQAEAFAYSTEKLVNDNKDKLSDDIVKEVTDKVNALKEALKGDDTEKVKTAQTELMTAAQKIGQVLYAQQGAEGAAAGAAGADGAGASAGSASGSDDDTVEAEVVDDDDDKDNK